MELAVHSDLIVCDSHITSYSLWFSFMLPLEHQQPQLAQTTKSLHCHLVACQGNSKSLALSSYLNWPNLHSP